MADDDYLTPAEFAALPSVAQHAVWAANADGRVEAITRPAGHIRRYRRAQVLALLAEMEASR